VQPDPNNTEDANKYTNMNIQRVSNIQADSSFSGQELNTNINISLNNDLENNNQGQQNEDESIIRGETSNTFLGPIVYYDSVFEIENPTKNKFQ